MMKRNEAKSAEIAAEKSSTVQSAKSAEISLAKETAKVKETTASKKAPKKEKKEASVSTFIQFVDGEVKAEELLDRIKEQYKNDGHRIGAIKSIETYINIAERKAYYVINGKAENKYVEF